MIFGKRTRNPNEWHEVFVIWPRKLVDGRWAMLHTVLRCAYIADHIPTSTPFDLFGWCYKELPKE